MKIEPHKGAVVTPITRDNIVEIYYMRSTLEGLAVESPSLFNAKEDKQQLEVLLVGMESLEISDDTNDLYIQLNASFHQTLKERVSVDTGNKMVVTLSCLLSHQTY